MRIDANRPEVPWSQIGVIICLHSSKSQFKPQVLAYLRQVEETGEPLTITDHGRPVVKIVPLADRSDLAALQQRWQQRIADGRLSMTLTRPFSPYRRMSGVIWHECGA